MCCTFQRVNVMSTEADMEGVIEGDDATSQIFGDESMEVTDEMIEQSQDKRSAAQAALSEGIT